MTRRDNSMMAFSDQQKKAFSDQVPLHNVYSLCNPAFTEAAFVSCHFDAFTTTVRRLSYEGPFDCEEDESLDCWLSTTMDLDVGSTSLQRSSSHHSNTSAKSSRSQTVRIKPRKYTSYMSSSASSISDKSLTSFPSFSPESPREERSLPPRTVDGTANGSRNASDSTLSIVENLTTTSPSAKNRSALFEDTPLSSQRVPGAIHHANDEHIERLIARQGAVALVRQIAADLAERDTQIATLRRKAEERERALRKIVLECGLSNLDLETRLRAIEGEFRTTRDSSKDRSSTTRESGLEDLMTDAMSETVMLGELGTIDNEATIRAADALRALEERPMNNAPKGWKDFIWGGTSRKSSRSSSVNGDAVNGSEPASIRNGVPKGRKTVLQNDLFKPPEAARSASRASSQQSGVMPNTTRERKPSSGLASLALKLVAGSTISVRDVDGVPIPRGRANSAGTTPPATNGRAPSTASTRTNMSIRTAPVKPTAKAVPGARRATNNAGQGTVRGPPQERWDTMGASPQSTASSGGADNYGPVEMDTILPPDAQPPTVTQIYNNPYNPEFLTDRFGFIYDQRRKKRQKEAAEKVQKTKRGSRLEMLSSARGISAEVGEDDANVDEERPDTPLSTEEREEDGKSKRWQDYLKIATFPTELLSHTPSGSVPAFEVMEGGEVPRSPGITTEERGFVPSARTVAIPPKVSVTSDNATISTTTTPAPPLSELAKEDTEPVKLLLQQLGEVHDSLQRDKTVRWNDFLRKVRAERKRDGEAAAAAIAADPRAQKPITPMPEASLTDGEIIGVAGLGNKGKVGRAKWNEFKILVLGGIPVAYRAKVWAECSGATALRIPGYYEDLVAHPEKEDDAAIIAQIQMDINRTLTDNIFFRKGPGVQKLNEVLLAYSRRNAEVGYCQGMNLITACLLLIMPTAEDAFWVLTSIIENILPQGYYDHSLLASRADQQVLRQYVSEILPKLSAHLDELSIELEALTFQWFLSVFTDCLSAEALFRVWDVVFCTNDGSTFLFQVALALLKLNEQQLLQCSTPAGLYTYINHQMTNHAISIDGLIHASEGLRKVVRREDVENRRAKAIEAEKEMGRLREEKDRLRKMQRLAALNGTVAEDKSAKVTEPVKQTSRASSMSRRGREEDRNDEYGEMRVRSPMPVEEERKLCLG